MLVLPGTEPPTPGSLLLVLIAMAGLCMVGLAHRRSSSLAWLAVIATLSVATLSVAAWGRLHGSAIGPTEWHWLAAVVCLGTVFATAAAAHYASERRRRVTRSVGWLAIVAVCLVGAICVWAFATLDQPDQASGPSLGNLAVVTRTLLVVVLVGIGLGILGDLRPAVKRTRARLDDGPPPHELPGKLGRIASGARILVDELAPGRSRARRAASAERSRIAVELHADVAPAIRQALLEAESGGSQERLVVALRDVLAEVDALAADRRSVALDELGLLPAIEWLAERTEARSDVRVAIDVVQPRSGVAAAAPKGDGRPPRHVEAAAFRVAQLALENVIRHAPNASACLELMVEPRCVRLAVSDDGPGIPADAAGAAVAGGRRGLADMRAEAEACGASLVTASDPRKRGTVVQFAWPSA
jgi:signal transduction histidine kinase